MKVAFFDAKPYDKPGFDAYSAGTGLEIKYFETKLNEDTVRLAKGFHEIRKSYGLISTNDDYKHCGNHPDSDLERMDA